MAEAKSERERVSVAELVKGPRGVQVVIDTGSLVKLAKSVVSGVAARLFWLLVIGFIVISLFTWLGSFFAADEESVLWNDGLQLHTDCYQGVQYLSKDGILTPRLDADGEIVTVDADC